MKSKTEFNYVYNAPTVEERKEIASIRRGYEEKPLVKIRKKRKKA